MSEPLNIRRRGVLGATGAILAAPAVAQPAAAVPPLVVLELDIPGLVNPVLRGFIAANPTLASGLHILRASLDDIDDGLREQVQAGTSGIDLVFSSEAGVLAGANAGLWQPALPWALAGLAPMTELTTPAGVQIWQGSAGLAVPITAGPGGPLLGWRPGQLARAPRNPAELLDWARQNPGRFLYPRPTLVTAGRLFVRALPALLGDRDLADPVSGWERSWSYLEELGRHIGYYPTSLAAAAAELSEGGCDLLPLTVGGDLALRGVGQLPADTQVAPFDGQLWAVASVCACLTRDLPAARQPLVAAMFAYLLAPSHQAGLLFGRGSDGQAGLMVDVDGQGDTDTVTHTATMQPRPELWGLLAQAQLLPALPWATAATAGRIWDERIGAVLGLP